MIINYAITVLHTCWSLKRVLLERLVEDDDEVKVDICWLLLASDIGIGVVANGDWVASDIGGCSRCGPPDVGVR